MLKPIFTAINFFIFLLLVLMWFFPVGHLFIEQENGGYLISDISLKEDSLLLVYWFLCFTPWILKELPIKHSLFTFIVRGLSLVFTLCMSAECLFGRLLRLHELDLAFSLLFGVLVFPLVCVYYLGKIRI